METTHPVRIFFLGEGAKEAFEAFSSAQALDVGQAVWEICKSRGLQVLLCA